MWGPPYDTTKSPNIGKLTQPLFTIGSIQQSPSYVRVKKAENTKPWKKNQRLVAQKNRYWELEQFLSIHFAMGIERKSNIFLS